MKMFKELNHVSITVTDVAKAREFYTGVLGFEEIPRPAFNFPGIWYGLGGGVIAWGVVTVAVRILADPVQRIAGLYGSAFTLRGLGPMGGLALIVSAIVLGWLGSFIAATLLIRGIEPR